MRWDLLRVGVRWAAAITLIGGALAMAMVALRKPGWSMAAPLLYAVGLLVAAVAMVAPELIDWISAPVRNFFHDLFFPRTEFRTLKPDYTLARYYRRQFRYSEALHWYRRILRDHPAELTAYLEAMATAFEGGEPRAAAKLRRIALRRLHDPALRREIRESYALLKAEAKNGTG